MLSKRMFLPFFVALALLGGACSSSHYRPPTQKDIDQVVEKSEDRIKNAPPLVPATVTFSISLENGSGQPILSGERVIAFKADGSIATVNRQHGANPRLVTAERHLELAGGTFVEVSDTAKSYTSVRIPNGDRSRTIARLDPKTNCEAEVGGIHEAPASSEHKNVLGYDVISFRIQTPDKRSTYWRAPALNCADLIRTDELLNPNGTIAARQEMLATKVVLGDPPHDLFEIPRDYKAVSFGEAFARETQAAKVEGGETNLRVFAEEDKFYDQYKQ